MTTSTWGIRTARSWMRATGLVLALAAVAGTVESAQAAGGVGQKPRQQPGPAAPGTITQPVAIPILSAVALNLATVLGGTQVGGTVTLIQPAPGGGVTVTLQSSNLDVAAVPGFVVVQPGAMSATFVLSTQAVATNPNVVPGTVSVTISARIGNATPKTSTLTVLPPALVSLALNPASVAGGVGSTGTVSINGPAPSGGYAITLSSQNPAATVPASVTVPKGANAASFSVTTKAVSANTAVPIVAARGVFSTKTATLAVLPPGVASVSLSNSFIDDHVPTEPGYPIAGKVKLTAPAPSGGATVELRVTPNFGTVPAFPCFPTPTLPATVQIPGGDTQRTFAVDSYPGSINFSLGGGQYHPAGPFKIHASFGGTWVSANFAVRTNRVVSLSVVPASVKGGTPVQGTATLNAPGPALPESCASSVRLTSSNSLVAQVPAPVAIPQGAMQVTFTITTSAVAQQTTVTITAGPGYGDKQASLILKPN